MGIGAEFRSWWTDLRRQGGYLLTCAGWTLLGIVAALVHWNLFGRSFIILAAAFGFAASFLAHRASEQRNSKALTEMTGRLAVHEAEVERLNQVPVPKGHDTQIRNALTGMRHQLDSNPPRKLLADEPSRIYIEGHCPQLVQPADEWNALDAQVKELGGLLNDLVLDAAQPLPKPETHYTNFQSRAINDLLTWPLDTPYACEWSTIPEGDHVRLWWNRPDNEESGMIYLGEFEVGDVERVKMAAQQAMSWLFTHHTVTGYREALQQRTDLGESLRASINDAGRDSAFYPVCRYCTKRPT